MQKALLIMKEIQKAVVGKNDIIEKLLLAVLSKGHVLLEDIPGVGKTTLALAFSKATSLSYKRMQFTPDVMPSDVTGFSVYNKASGRLEYKPGAALCNLFLADEINRTSSKTQAALLEVMEEGSITVDGVTREVPKPYTVIATQNPTGSAGTQLLPESQLDRFIIRLTMGYPDLDSEIEILKRKQGQDPLESVTPVADADDILAMQEDAGKVYLSDEVYRYIATLVARTREHPKILLGASPRASIALTKMGRASAFLRSRDYVVPQDIRHVFFDVMSHRMILEPQAKLEREAPETVLRQVLLEVKEPSVVS